jgi:hypothetical protein
MRRDFKRKFDITSGRNEGTEREKRAIIRRRRRNKK